MKPGRHSLPFFDQFARVGAVVVAAVGGVVIFGWVLNLAPLKNVLPGLASMKINTACAFLFAGAALWLVHTCAPGPRLFRLARALAAIVAALGGLSLAEDLFGLELGIDQLILPDVAPATALLHPGRMSPATALNFLFIGLALLALKARQPRVAANAHWLAVFPLFVSTLAIVGYAYGVSSLYAVSPYTSMAMHTALAFFILTLSIVSADPEHGAARIASSDTAGGIVVRRLLPTIPVILFALGWVLLKEQHSGLYDDRFGLALMVLLSITVCVVAVISTAVTLHRVDVTRKRGEAKITSLNAGLEIRVEERTRTLARMSAELSTANKSLEQLSLQDGLTELANRRSFDKYLAAQSVLPDIPPEYASGHSYQQGTMAIFPHRALYIEVGRTLLAALALILCVSSGWAAEPRVLVLTDSNDPPYTNTERTGFLDVVATEAVRRAGLELQIVKVPAERALMLANAGVDDGDMSRIAGLETQYPNLIRVPEKLVDRQYVAFSKDASIGASLDAIRGRTVGLIRGWKIFERAMDGAQHVIKVDDAEQLFRLLQLGRIDVALYERAMGQEYIMTHGMKSVRVLDPSLYVREMFIYLHQSNAERVPALAAALRAMKRDGFYRRAYNEKLSPYYDRSLR